jgi:hypothetical protein
VTVSAPAATTVDVDGQGPRSGDFSTAVTLNAGQGFQVLASSGSTASTYYIRCLPSDFPAWTFTRSGTPQAEWYMVAPFARTDFSPPPPGVSPNYGAIFDAHGVPVWWFKKDHVSLDFKLLANGNVAWAYFVPPPGAEERRLDGSLARTLAPAAPVIDSHEIQLLPNGDYLVPTQRAVPGQTICGQPNLPLADNGVQEFTPDGAIVWSWWASEHIPLSEVPSAWCNSILATPAGDTHDAFHINSIEPDGAGYLLSFRHLDAVYKISRTDGSVIWKLGGTPRPKSLTVLNDPHTGDIFRGQHDARVLSDGSVTVHDNGFHPSSGRPPRAVRYSIDTSAMTATLVEQMNDPDTLTAVLCCGSARKLPGGDWVMAWGSDGLVTELSPSGGRVFSLTFDDGLFSYRAYPVPFGTLSRTALRDGMQAQFPRGYARPRGAPLLRVPLVPAFKQCLSPNRAHGAPLAFGSCGSPAGASSFLTVGTPDANGAPAQSLGLVAYRAHVGDSSTPANEADVAMTVSVTDVRRKTDLSDYTGELQVQGSIRVTDRANGSLHNEAATGVDTEYPVAVPCTATASSTIGATCSLSTTFNAIVPGTVVEGKRATWQFGQVQVFDGGASETAGGSGASLFETQGVFVP